ncbi:hypothetical protein CALCODRAFT_510770 [Calocera cornea HHB12733]|uniref:CxC2-like cysteine cluster KDZ transposase-associated domain-containing protein n=1 Tax=Calocera cornea HHB12733 TaxID=1353952 RepID=A0A165EAP7_9BASI|nr:hypothetical protein CALCODRAFT_510770 [Calocera cornea HHB12733]
MSRKRRDSSVVVEIISPKKARVLHEELFLDRDGRIGSQREVLSPGRRSVISKAVSSCAPPLVQPPLLSPRSPEKIANETPPSKKHVPAPFQDYLDNKQQFESEIIGLEYDMRIGTPCLACVQRDGATTICQDCFDPTPLCKSCQVRTHARTPFHWIREWRGSFFARVTLGSLGISLHLCRNARVCPANHDVVQEFTIVAVNGVHSLSVSFCHCAGAPPHFLQLLRFELFPASVRAPRTAFTIAVLRDFHLHSLTGKLSAYDYWGKLARQTNNVFPELCPDRYREFMRAHRFYTELQSLKRSGSLHSIQSSLPAAFQSASRVMLCPACPQIGINIQPEEIDELAEGDRFLAQSLQGGDGNFSLASKGRKSPWVDVSMRDGKGLFPREADFKAFLLKHGSQDKKIARTCSRFQQPMLLGGPSGLKCTGIYATSCLRHSLYTGAVDLQLGERLSFVNVDYAFARTAVRNIGLPRHIWSYDFCCGWSANAEERLQQRFPELVDEVPKFVWAVPKMHEHAHQEWCRYQFSLAWIEGGGRTDGEGVERPWSELNQLSASTKEMTAGHRKEVLEDHMTGWNWKKVMNMVPTRAEIIAGLRLEEAGEERVLELEVSATSPIDAAVFINMGLTIEVNQNKLKRRVEELSQSDGDVEDRLQRDRTLLLSQISRWYHVGETFLPGRLRSDWTVETEEHPEDMVLPLPSAFNVQERDLNISGLALIELRLRKGEATDVLRQLVAALRLKQAYANVKWKAAHNQVALTRMRSILERQQKAILRHADSYRRMRAAMLRVGLQADDPQYQPLLDSDVRLPALSQVDQELGSSKRYPWFMRRGEGATSGVDHGRTGAMEDRANIVVYWVLKATLERWSEELRLLDAEWVRMERYFLWYETFWLSKAGDGAVNTGHTVYAARQGHMWAALRDKCSRLKQLALIDTPII